MFSDAEKIMVLEREARSLARKAARHERRVTELFLATLERPATSWERLATAYHMDRATRYSIASSNATAYLERLRGTFNS